MKRTSMRKKCDVQIAVGIRFDVALGEAARLEIARACTSAFLHLASWNVVPGAGRTYVRATWLPEAPPEATGSAALAALAGRLGASLASPPRAALDVRPHDPAFVPVLRNVLAGAGAPAGVVDAVAHATGVALECELATTRLGTLVATIDAALGGAARAIVPLRPLEDDALAALAADVLGEPALDAGRIVETHVDRLLAAALGCGD